MRISYLFNSSTPSSNPSSIQVVNTCGALASLLHDVKLVVPNTGFKTSLSKFYGLKKPPKLIRLKYFDKTPFGINYYLFSIFSILYGILNKTEVYITRNLFTLFLLNILKKKTIVEVHHNIDNEGRLVKFLYRNCDVFNKKNILKVIAITNPVKKYLLNNYKIDKKKIQIISSASSLKFKFKKLRKKKIYNIGYFGSLDQSKGSNFIIDLSKVDKHNNYFIYGGLKEEVIKLKKNISKNLKIYPRVPYSKIRENMSKMDILLMPSNPKKLKSLCGVGNIAKFTSPLKLFDYLASGKLIISSNLKVFNEIIKDKQNCIIADKLDTKSWVKVINKISSNLIKVNKIKKNAFDLSKKFTYLKRVKKIMDI